MIAYIKTNIFEKRYIPHFKTELLSFLLQSFFNVLAIVMFNVFSEKWLATTHDFICRNKTIISNFCTDNHCIICDTYLISKCGSFNMNKICILSFGSCYDIFFNIHTYFVVKPYWLVLCWMIFLMDKKGKCNSRFLTPLQIL